MGIRTSQNSVIVVTLANSEGSEFKRGHIPIGSNLRQNSFRVACHPGRISANSAAPNFPSQGIGRGSPFQMLRQWSLGKIMTREFSDRGSSGHLENAAHREPGRKGGRP
jgi:hypothetical protein